MKAMPRRERLSYIAYYYGLWIAGALAVLVFLIWFAWHSATAIRQNWLYAAFPNAMTRVGNESRLWDDYLDYAGYDISKKNLEFNDELWFDPTKNSGMNNTYYQSFVALTESGVLDVVTMRRQEIEALGKSGRLLDLSSEKAGDLFEAYKDRLVYSVPYDESYSKDPVPVGIDVSDSILMTKYHLYEDSCVLAIGSYSRNLKEAVRFLDWILGGKVKGTG